MTPLLSVCIPTFSNPRGVEAALRKLIAEATARDSVEKLEFCIADNSEDSNTAIVVEEAKTRGDIAIHYQRHGQNLGYDRNVDAVLKMARGEFCWLLSDNDTVADGALEAIMASTTAYQDSGVIVICPHEIKAENLRTYANMEEAMLANDLWVPGGLVSRNIIKRVLIPKDLSSYFGNDWLHLSITTTIGGRCPVTFISEKFVHDPNEKSRWAKNGKTFITYTNLLGIMMDLPVPPYSREFVHAIVRRMRRGLPRNIVSSKLYGLKMSRENWRRLYEACRGEWPWLWLSVLAMLTPMTFVAYAKSIKQNLGH